MTTAKTKRSQSCSTCGKKRGPLEQRRESWGIHDTPDVPRRDDPEARPWQIHNDLITSVSVYRNGGTSGDTHLCDDCLRIGLRDIKLKVDEMLEVVEEGADKDAELAQLTERLSKLQYQHNLTGFEYDRAIKRVAALLKLLPDELMRSKEAGIVAWEVAQRQNQETTL
jgi:hypothetical protein